MRRLLASSLVLLLVACATAKSPPPAPPRPPRVTAFLPVPPACEVRHGTSFSSDAAWLVSLCDDALEVRDASTGWVTAQRSLAGHNARASLSQDGSLVAHSAPGAVLVRDRATLSLRAKLPDSNAGGRLSEYTWDFSPDNRRIAVAFGTGPLLEATLADGKVTWQVNDVRTMTGLRYVNNGSAVCVGFWNAFAAGKPQDFPWFKQVRGYSSFNADGSRLATGDAHDFKVLDTATGATVAQIDNYAGGELRWYGKQVGSGVGKLELVSPEHPEQKLTVKANLSSGQETPDGARLRGVESDTLVEWQLSATPVRRQLAWSDRVPRYRTRPVPLPGGGTVDWWRAPNELAEGLSITQADGVARRLTFDKPPRDFGVDPRQPRVAVLFADSIAIYDTNSLRLFRELKVPEGTNEVELTSRGELADVSPQRIRLTNLADGSVRALGSTSDPYGLKFSPDAHYLAYNAGGTGVTVLGEAGPVTLAVTSRIESFAFSLDSRLIHLLLEHDVASFDLATGKEVARRKLDFDCKGEVLESGGVWCTTPTGEVEAPPGAPPHAISAPRVARPRVLEFRDQELRLALPSGALLRWHAPELEASVEPGPPVTGNSQQPLKPPPLSPVLQSLVAEGAVHVALSDDARLLAFVDESNTLEVRAATAAKTPGRRYFLRDAPGVFGISFDPSGRFVLLHGAPLRFVRLSDGETLNLYVGYLDHLTRVTAPLLFVSEHDQLDGDPALARALFCDSRPEAVTEPCRLPQPTPGLPRRFFEAR